MQSRHHFDWKRLPGLILLVLAISLCGAQIYAMAQQERMNQALIAAVKGNDTAKALILLEEGADPNAREHPSIPRSFRQQATQAAQFVWHRLQGKTSLMDTPPAALLLLCRARRTADGSSEFPRENLILLQALLDRGADVNAADSDGYTSLAYAVAYGNWAAARLLVERGADVNTRGYDEQPILMSAVTQPSLARLLLAKGADTGARSSTGSTALMAAAEYNQAAVVRLLLARGADIQATDNNGDTALMYAIEDYAGDCVKILLQRGAEVHTKNRLGQTPQSLALSRGDPAILQLLKQSEAEKRR